MTMRLFQPDNVAWSAAYTFKDINMQCSILDTKRRVELMPPRKQMLTDG